MNTEQRYNKDYINFLENKNYQKTAIGYIQYLYDYRPEYNLIEEDFIFAKQMEKEQIINAHINGYDSSGGCANEYYNEKHGK